MQPRTKRALALGACLFAFYLAHLAWFRLFGPPDWFQGVQERAPDISSMQLSSEYDRYLRELSSPRGASAASAQPPLPPDMQGRVNRRDMLPDGTAALVWSKQGRVDHVYLWRQDRPGWHESMLAGPIADAVLLPAPAGVEILTERRQPWWPYNQSYRRFWAALIEPQLRPDSRLDITDHNGAFPRFIASGSGPVASPDRRAVAFVRSEDRGFHSVHLWKPDAGEVTTVVSLWEMDPGSGRSFDYSWSADSRVLFVRGDSLGYDPARPASRVKVRLLYEVEADRLVELR